MQAALVITAIGFGAALIWFCYELYHFVKDRFFPG